MIPALNPPANDVFDLTDRLARDLRRERYGSDDLIGIMGWLAENGWYSAWMRDHGLDRVMFRLAALERCDREAAISAEVARIALARAADADRMTYRVCTVMLIAGLGLCAWGGVLHIGVGG